MKFAKNLLFLLGFGLTACTGYLAENGKTDYRIVLTDASDTLQQQAAAELQTYLYQMSGARLPIETDKGAKNIYIGFPQTAPEAITSFDRDQLQSDGFYLKTIQDDLYILGGTEKGVLYGTYELLEQLGCRQYSAEAQYIPAIDKLKLPKLDDIQVPVIQYRDVLYTHAKTEPFRSWHRLDVPLIGEQREEWGYWCHSFFDLVDPENPVL